MRNPALVTRCKAVEDFHRSEAPADEAWSAPVDADHVSLSGCIRQVAIAPGIQGHGFNTSKISRWPFIHAGTIPMPEQTPGSGRTRTPSPWTQPRASCTIPDKPDYSALAGLSEECCRLRTTLTHVA